jgi:hypothetical protein
MTINHHTVRCSKLFFSIFASTRVDSALQALTYELNEVKKLNKELRQVFFQLFQFPVVLYNLLGCT